MQVKQPNFMRLGARQHPKDVLFIQVLLGHLPAGRYNHPNKKTWKDRIFRFYATTYCIHVATLLVNCYSRHGCMPCMVSLTYTMHSYCTQQWLEVPEISPGISQKPNNVCVTWHWMAKDMRLVNALNNNNCRDVQMRMTYKCSTHIYIKQIKRDEFSRHTLTLLS